jgi:hypothetical protein
VIRLLRRGVPGSHAGGPARLEHGRARRLVALGAIALGVVGFAAFGLAPGVAAADAPNTITITGTGLSAPVTVPADKQSDLFNALMRQVSWMVGRAGDFFKPNQATLGPKFTLTVFTNGVAVQSYELYPAASGGPRAHRPAAQPHGKTTEAWFYAPVSLPVTLRAAGVAFADPSGRAGGSAYEDPRDAPVSVAQSDPFSLAKEFGPARLALAGTAGTGLAVLLLLFAAARLSRRYGRRS